MTHLDLFSGIGGFALAAKWGGFETVGFCEINPYCQELLKLRFPGVKIYNDIRRLTHEQFIADSEGWESRKQTERKGRKNISGGNIKIDLLTGGFPCQPFSCAGRRRGTEDDRFLWPEMFRVIKEFRPRWIIGENVNGITNMVESGGEIGMEGAGDTDAEDGNGISSDGILWGIIESLEDLGYSIQPLVIPACAVGAPHRRDRIWIIAHRNSDTVRHAANSDQLHDDHAGHGAGEVCGKQRWETTEIQGCSIDNYTRREGLEGHARNGHGSEGRQNPAGSVFQAGWECDWLEVASALCRVDDGLPVSLDGFKLSKSKHREERLKGLGNAIVPQIAFEIMRKIREVER